MESSNIFTALIDGMNQGEQGQKMRYINSHAIAHFIQRLKQFKFWGLRRVT